MFHAVNRDTSLPNLHQLAFVNDVGSLVEPLTPDMIGALPCSCDYWYLSVEGRTCNSQSIPDMPQVLAGNNPLLFDPTLAIYDKTFASNALLLFLSTSHASEVQVFTPREALERPARASSVMPTSSAQLRR